MSETLKSAKPQGESAVPATPIAQMRPPRYPFAAIEQKWQDRWEEQKLYQVDLQQASKPYYNLMMFPYPSAEGLHVGNVYAYVGSDVQGRWRAMQGYDVFEPIGFDAFGIHSENFAIKRGIHPQIVTAHNITRFREKQLKRIGNRFDWSHDLQTTDPTYYRWTQWIFLQLFKGGLVERKTAPVNWCPNDKTVLADEQVIDGRCERCDAVVERRWLRQWFLKLSNYAQRLLDGLDHLDWSERVKAAQRSWIGRSNGLEFSMAIVDRPALNVQVYTTRPDTIFGMTFVALAPHHALVAEITSPERQTAVRAYQQTANCLRAGEERVMTGVFTGSYALHPLTGAHIPIWIADFVLDEHGSGAIMGVPAHDGADLLFARTMDLPVHIVVQSADPQTPPYEADTLQAAFTQSGILVASGAYSGMTSRQASDAIVAWFEAQGNGKRSVKYRLRDWLIGRQRYWGPPIPIIYCPEHGTVPVPEEDLPVLLPETEDWMPSGTGESPLAAIESFVHTVCPICGQPARRETDVSDNFLDNSWYFLRYPSHADTDRPWDPELLRKWLPVDMYIGGAEHSVLHLMYVRFITMALHDLGHLPFSEPFKRFVANGTLTKDGSKISKSRGNVINPDDYVEHFGADVLRLYLLFMGPYEAGGDFTDRGIGGVVRYLDRVWRIVTQHASSASRGKPSREAKRAMHQTIKQVTKDIEAIKYNTAIATLMEYLNSLEGRPEVTYEELRTLLLLLAPLAPHITEELWEQMGQPHSIHTTPWPIFDPAAIHMEVITLPVQVNGRVRDQIQVPYNMPEEELTELALASEKVQRFIVTQTISKTIYVPGKLVNIVTK